MKEERRMHVTAFLAVASSSSACLSALERRSAFFCTSIIGYTVENGIALAQMWEEEDHPLPYLGIYGGSRFLAAVGKSELPLSFAERTAKACARYGKKMRDKVPRDIPYAVFDGAQKRFFFSSSYIAQELGTLWISSHAEMLSQPHFADFGSFTVK